MSRASERVARRCGCGAPAVAVVFAARGAPGTMAGLAWSAGAAWDVCEACRGCFDLPACWSPFQFQTAEPILPSLVCAPETKLNGREIAPGAYR